MQAPRYKGYRLWKRWPWPSGEGPEIEEIVMDSSGELVAHELKAKARGVRTKTYGWGEWMGIWVNVQDVMAL